MQHFCASIVHVPVWCWVLRAQFEFLEGWSSFAALLLVSVCMQSTSAFGLVSQTFMHAHVHVAFSQHPMHSPAYMLDCR